MGAATTCIIPEKIHTYTKIYFKIITRTRFLKINQECLHLATPPPFEFGAFKLHQTTARLFNV